MDMCHTILQPLSPSAKQVCVWHVRLHSQQNSFFSRWVSAGTQFFKMGFDELPAGGVRPQPVVDVAGPLVRDMRQRSKDMALSLDVPALQTAKGVGPQAPGWVLKVPVPLIRETTQKNKEILTEMELRTSQELPEVLVVERRRPPRAAQSVAVPKIVLLDGIQQRGGVQTVDTPAPQVGEG